MAETNQGTTRAITSTYMRYMCMCAYNFLQMVMLFFEL